jgi:hypothetical protein
MYIFSKKVCLQNYLKKACSEQYFTNSKVCRTCTEQNHGVSSSIKYISSNCNFKVMTEARKFISGCTRQITLGRI